MTVKEMHIGIDQNLQKSNSKNIDSLYDEEKDWALNEEQLRFIRDRLSPKSNAKREGFEDTQKRYDDLEELITRSDDPQYPYDKTALIKNLDAVYLNLPPNYLHLINDRSLVDNLCNSSFSNQIQQSKTIYYCLASLFEDTTHLYSTFQIKVNGVTKFDITSFSSLVFTTTEEKFILINTILNWFNTNGYIVYWESFNGKTYPNQFVFVNNVNFNNIQIVYNGRTDVFNTQSTLVRFYQSDFVKEVPNRLTKTEDVFEILRSAFGKTVVDSPVSTMERNQIVVYHKKRFIITEILIQYIRNPRLISLSLNQHCELNPRIHDEIVLGASTRLSALLESRNYNQVQNEDNKKE